MRSASLRHELRRGLSGDRLLVRRYVRRCVPSRLSGPVSCVPEKEKKLYLTPYSTFSWQHNIHRRSEQKSAPKLHTSTSSSARVHTLGAPFTRPPQPLAPSKRSTCNRSCAWMYRPES